MLTSPLLRTGKWSKGALAFIGIVAIQTVLNITMEGYIISTLQHDNDESQRALYIVYNSGFIVAQLFAAGLSFTGLQLRSGPLTTTATAFDLVLVILSIAQMVQARDAKPIVALQAASISMMAVACASKALLLWKELRREFGWQVYRALGADLYLQRIFYLHQTLLSAVTLGALLFVEFWLHAATITVQSDERAGSWIQNAAALIVCFAVLCLTLFAAIQELPWLMYACSAVFAATPAYLVYKLVAVNQPAQDPYRYGRRYLTLFLALLLVLDAALLVLSLLVARSLGKGLRQRLRHFQILARSDVDLVDIASQKASMSPDRSVNWSFVTLTRSCDVIDAVAGCPSAALRPCSDGLLRAFMSGVSLPLEGISIRSHGTRRGTRSRAECANLGDRHASAPGGIVCLREGRSTASLVGSDLRSLSCSVSLVGGGAGVTTSMYTLSEEEIATIYDDSVVVPKTSHCSASSCQMDSSCGEKRVLMPPPKCKSSLWQSDDELALYRTLQQPLSLRVTNPDPVIYSEIPEADEVSFHDETSTESTSGDLCDDCGVPAADKTRMSCGLLTPPYTRTPPAAYLQQ